MGNGIELESQHWDYEKASTMGAVLVNHTDFMTQINEMEANRNHQVMINEQKIANQTERADALGQANQVAGEAPVELRAQAARLKVEQLKVEAEIHSHVTRKRDNTNAVAISNLLLEDASAVYDTDPERFSEADPAEVANIARDIRDQSLIMTLCDKALTATEELAKPLERKLENKRTIDVHEIRELLAQAIEALSHVVGEDHEDVATAESAAEQLEEEIYDVHSPKALVSATLTQIRQIEDKIAREKLVAKVRVNELLQQNEETSE